VGGQQRRMVKVQKQTDHLPRKTVIGTQTLRRRAMESMAPQAAYGRVTVASDVLAPADLLTLQHTVGNRGVQRILAQRSSSVNGEQHRVSRKLASAGPKTRVEKFPWIGRIEGTYSAALRNRPYKNPSAPHTGTLADLPRGQFVDVIGRKGGWFHVRASIKGTEMEGYVSQELVAFNRWDIDPVATAPQKPVASSAGAGFDQFLLQFDALEQAAIAEGFGFSARITAFRKLYYDSKSAAKTYAGAVVGGGVWNILIPGAAGTNLPQSWSTPALQGAADYLRKNQVLSIGGQSVDIGHLLAGADASQHPASIALGGGTINLRSNVEATTFIGDLGSVVTEYIHGSTASFRDVAMERSKLLETYYDGAKGMASAADMSGNADAFSLSFDPSKKLTESFRAFYTATTGGAKKRFTTFITRIGLGTLKGTTFTGDTKAWRTAMTEEVFNSALAYAAGKGWRGDVINVLNDPGPGFTTPTFWEMYWNNSEWVVDIFVARMAQEVAKE
jgi:hypothetical protein